MFTVRLNKNNALALTSKNYTMEIPAESEKVLRNYFLESMGLWLDEESGYFVSRHRDMDGEFIVAKFGDAPDLHWRTTEEDRGDVPQEALSRYLDTLPDVFEHGEIWEVQLEGGLTSTASAAYSEYGDVRLFLPGEMAPLPPGLPCKRLLTADRKYLG